MCGPTGIGFLWGSYELLERMPPWMGGGEMIQVRVGPRLRREMDSLYVAFGLVSPEARLATCVSQLFSQDVFLDHSTYADPPMRFEAGTPAIAEAIGFGAACDYLENIGLNRIHQFEEDIGR